MKVKQLKQELKQLTNKQLLAELSKEYDNLRDLQFKVKMRELKNIKAIKQSRQKIARILTFLRQNLEKETPKGENK